MDSDFPAETPTPPEPLSPPPVTQRPPPDRTTWSKIAGPIIGGVAGSALTLVVLTSAGVFSDPEPVSVPIPPPSVIREIVETPVIASIPENQITAIAERAVPSIVSVDVGQGSGSGVVYRADGYILTNNHVVEIGPNVEVVFPDGRIYPATVTGTDPLTDLAVLKVDIEALTPISIADLTSLSIGDLAVAVGNPLGLQGGPSVTSGIISALDRALTVDDGTRLFGLIQTDAPITRGSSGGALVNESGELIGITTAIGTSGIAAEGLGFAVPGNVVEQVAIDLIRDGLVKHAFLGITGTAAFEETSDGASVPLGARIEELPDGSAIALAGAEVGDIIVSFDGREVERMDQLVALLRNYRADDAVTVIVLRGDEEVILEVVLDLRPEGL